MLNRDVQIVLKQETTPCLIKYKESAILHREIRASALNALYNLS